MRYSVRSLSLGLQQVEIEVKKTGASNIKTMSLVKQVMCDLTLEQSSELSSKGLIVRPIKGVRSAIIYLPETTVVATGISMEEAFKPLRDYYSPPLAGTGLTAAVLDSGIRETHKALLGKVVYSANLSTSPPGDKFDHGTNCASIIVAISPAAKLMDIKVLNDTGEGTEESAISGIEEVCRLVGIAIDKRLPFTHSDYPNVLSISFGGEDSGDYDNPLRAACRVAVEDYNLEVICAQGNSGPVLSTVLNPACEPLTIAVGAIKETAFEVAEYSSRGPTLLGDIKPDFVTWGEGIRVASAKSDDEYLNKSGTSFSAPILVGGRGLLGDLARRVYGEQYDVTWHDIEAVAPLFCVKVEDAPLRKDNDWGYGFPMFGVIASQVTTPTAATSIGQLLSGIVMIGVLGMVMRTIR